MSRGPSAAQHVVVVEDDPDVLSSLKFALEIEGFHVHPYTNGEALLESDASPTCGCLVLDYVLPGMNGLELLGRLRQSGRDLPALIITTPNAEVARRAALAGVSIVEKPLLSDILVSRVRDLLGPARTPAGSGGPTTG